MLQRSILTIILFLFANACVAGEKAVPVKLSVEKAVALHCALAATKGNDKQPYCANVETYEDTTGDRPVTKRYIYRPSVTGAMAKNIVALRSSVDEFQRSQQVLQEKIFVASPPPKSDDAVETARALAEYNRAREKEMIEFNKQVRLLGDDDSRPINLFKFSDVDLGIADSVPQKERNTFPASLLATLDPIRE